MTHFTGKQLQAFEDFCECVEALEPAVRTLKQQLRQLPRRCTTTVFALPRRASDFEPPADVIIPEPLTGATAFDRALEALSDWYARPGGATKAVHRTPGVMQVHNVGEATEQGLMEQIESINAIKRTLRGHLKAMGRSEKRHDLIHRRYFMLQVSQLIRGLTMLRCPPAIQSITFSWGFKTEIRTTTVDEVCQHLERLRPLHVDCPEDSAMSWSERVSIEQNRMRSLAPGTALRWRRELPVRPLTNIRWHFSEQEQREREEAQARGEAVSSPTIMREAHTPILIFNPSPGLKIGRLGTFDANERRRRQARVDRKCGRYPLSDLVNVFAVSSSGQL